MPHVTGPKLQAVLIGAGALLLFTSAFVDVEARLSFLGTPMKSLGFGVLLVFIATFLHARVDHEQKRKVSSTLLSTMFVISIGLGVLTFFPWSSVHAPPPDLTNPTLNPSSGDTSTFFNFTIDYIQSLGLAANVVRVNVSDATNNTYHNFTMIPTEATDMAYFVQAYWPLNGTVVDFANMQAYSSAYANFIQEHSGAARDQYTNQKNPTACVEIGNNWTNCDDAFSSTDIYAYANDTVGGGGPISFIDATEQSVSGTSLTVNVPTQQDGDTLITVLVHSDDAPAVTITPPGGWNLVRDKTGMGTATISPPVLYIYEREASSEPGSYVWSWDLTGGLLGVMLAYRDTDAASPIGQNAVNAQTGTGTDAIAPSVTTTEDNELALWIGWSDDDDGNDPSATLGRGDVRAREMTAAGGNGAFVGIGDENIPSPGATGTATWTLTAVEERSGVTITLLPAAGAGSNDTAWRDYGYALNVSDTVDRVEVGIELWRVDAGNVTNVTVSWDGGSTWAANQTATNKSSNDDTLEWLDFTSATTWDDSKLSDANFRTRAISNGSGQRLDHIPVRVTFTTTPTTDEDRNPTACVAYGANWTLCDNGFSSDDVYAYANGSTVQGAVVSVERFQVWLDGISTDFRALTQGQNISNTVPFLSKSISGIGTSDFWNRFSVEATFTDTPTKRVTLTRNNPTANLTVYVTVVEFNPSIIKVQSGTFSLTSGSTTPSIPEAVVLAKTALMFDYQSTDGTDDHTDNRVRGRITSTTQLTFNVDGTSGTKSGTWWVMESLDATWDVQTADLTFGSSATSATDTITSVDVDKSFLITSWDTSESSDDSQDGALQVNLTDSTTVTGTRAGSPSATLDAHVFVVTFSGDEAVQRHDMSMTGLSHTDTIASVDLSVATIFATTHDAEFSASGTDSPIDDSFVRLWLTDSTTVQGDRADQAGDGTITWQVIEWVTTRAAGNDTEWKDFGYSITETVHQVQVGVEWYRTSAKPVLDVTVSWDGGSTWATNQTATNKSADDDTTEWLDFTGATSWDGTKLGDANFRVAAGTNNSDGRLDNLTARVTYGVFSQDILLVQLNTTGIRSGEPDELIVRYNLTAPGDTFNVEVWNGTDWNVRGNLDQTSVSFLNYSLNSEEKISGEVKIRLNDTSDSGVPNLSIQWQLVNSTLWKSGMTYYYNGTLPVGWYDHFFWTNDTDGNSNMTTTYPGPSVTGIASPVVSNFRLEDLGVQDQRNPAACEAFGNNWTNCDDAFSSNDVYAYANESGAGQTLNLALIVADPASLDPNVDVPLRDHLETTLGHTVTLKDDIDQAYDPTTYDAIVISESVISGNAAWLKTEVVGILTVEGSNWDEFELGTGGDSLAGGDTDVDITDNGHYITSTFPTGVRTVTTVTTNLGQISGWANDVLKLAHYDANPTMAKLLAVEKGGVLQGGTNTAADRRVFYGAQYFANLNGDGRTLLNRSLDWVAYSTAGKNDTAWRDFGYSLNPSDPINKVEVGVEWHRTSSSPVLDVTVSWDGGTSWATNQTATNKSFDDDSLEWLDFTSATSWTDTKLNDTNFRVRLGTNASDARVDYVTARVHVGNPQSKTGAQIDVDVEHYFVFNVTDDDGWSDIGSDGNVSLHLWYDGNATPELTYSEQTTGANYRIELEYVDTSDPFTASLGEWSVAEGRATYNAARSSLTEILSGSTVIGYEFRLALKLGYQVKHANDPINGTTGAYNDVDSWNAEVVAYDGANTVTLQAASTGEHMEFGVFMYTFVSIGGDWTVTLGPGQTVSTNTVTVYRRSNDDFKMTVWFVTHLDSGSDTIDISNVQILAAADPGDNITADLAFAGLGEGNARFIYGTTSWYFTHSTDTDEDTVSVQFSVTVPFGPASGTYTAQLTIQVTQRPP